MIDKLRCRNGNLEIPISRKETAVNELKTKDSCCGVSGRHWKYRRAGKEEFSDTGEGAVSLRHGVAMGKVYERK